MIFSLIFVILICMKGSHKLTSSEQPKTFSRSTKNKILNNKLGNFSIITVTNYGYKDFTLNWLINMKKLNLTKFLVFCYDTKVYGFLKSRGYIDNLLIVPDEWLDSKLASDFTDWNTSDYNEIVRAKSNVWYQMLSHNHHILFSDPDVVIKYLNDTCMILFHFCFCIFFYFRFGLIRTSQSICSFCLTIRLLKHFSPRIFSSIILAFLRLNQRYSLEIYLLNCFNFNVKTLTKTSKIFLISYSLELLEQTV